MALWLVRAGRRGEQEALALENNLAVIGWSDLPDLARFKTREELEVLCRNTYPNEKPHTITNWVGGGFKNSVISEARRLFFESRLWEAGDLVRALLANYDRLSEDIRAEIPLKRLRVLVLEE